MEEMIRELKKIVPLKETTSEGDIVLIALEEPQSVVYGLVTEIQRDIGKRDEWWHVTLHILSVPPQQATWTLREPQFTGQELFTMGGKGRFVQALKLEKPKPLKEKSQLVKDASKPSRAKKSEKKSVLRRVK